VHLEISFGLNTPALDKLLPAQFRFASERHGMVLHQDTCNDRNHSPRAALMIAVEIDQLRLYVMVYIWLQITSDRKRLSRSFFKLASRNCAWALGPGV
jgi:hypothetical protein